MEVSLARSLRIMHVVYSFGIGGSETVAREVAMRLGDRGHTNMVVALEHDGPLSDEFRSKGIPAHAVNRAEISMLGAMFRVFQLVRKFRPDVLHTHHMYMLFYTVPASLLTRTPIIHTEHEFWSLDTPKGRLFMPVLGMFCRWITAVNEETRLFMARGLKLQKRKLVTVPNGIDLTRFASASVLQRSDFGLNANDCVAVIVARLEPVKNHSMLLRAWRIVVDSVPGAKLLVIGAGSLGDTLRDESTALGLSERVNFLGPRRDVHAILPLADVAVLTSHDEGLPLSLLEAMAAGLPVVSTNVGGVPEVVRDGVNGILVQGEDPQVFAKAVIRVFNDLSSARNMGKDGRKLVERTYDLDVAVGRYLELYTS